MDDKLLEQVGHFIGQTRAEVLALTDHRIEKAIELVQDEIAKNQTLAVEGIVELNKELVDSVNDSQHTTTAQHVEQIAALTDQIQAQEIFEAQLTTRLSEIKDGEKGNQGEQGNDGLDGLDQPLLEPVALVAQKDYPKSTLGTHAGGLWIATKQTIGSPEDDPQAWHCILDAMTEMRIDLQEDRTFKLSVRMGTGKLIENELHIPFPDHKGIWEEGSYAKGDIVTKGSHLWLAQETTEGSPPGNGWQQILSAPRGKQGPAGKSIEGPQGKPGRNGMDALLPANFVDDIIALAGERKAFEDGRSGSEAIISFRGYFSPSETYRSGDVVNDIGGLLLCISGGQFSSIAAGQDSWELMLGTPKLGMPAFMQWRYPYVEGATYNANQTTRQSIFTGVANQETSEPLAPVPTGDPFWPTDGAPFVDAFQLIGVKVGNQYTMADEGVVLSALVDVPVLNVGLLTTASIHVNGVQIVETTYVPRTSGIHTYNIPPLFVFIGDIVNIEVDVVNQTGNTQCHYLWSDAYWDTYSNPMFSSVAGLFDEVPNTNAYNLDLQFQEAEVSEHWDILAVSPASLVPDEAINAAQRIWVQSSTDNLEDFEVSTTGNVWTEIGRYPVADQSAVRGTSWVTGTRKDGTLDAFYYESRALITRDGTVEEQVEVICNFTPHPSVGFKSWVDVNDLVFEVRGSSVSDQAWDWKMTYFVRDIT